MSILGKPGSAFSMYENVTISGGIAHLGHQYNFTLPSHVELVDKRSRLLDSLRHDDMNARASAVEDAQEETFHWLFERSDEGSEQLQERESYSVPTYVSQVEPSDVKPPELCLNHFPTWLRHGGSTYLIEGKPGSGKSTLMKYIRDSPLTTKLLPRNSESDPVIVACHFFWLAGSKLQRSYKGLLSSLSFQILGQIDIAQIPVHSGEVLGKRVLADWAEKEIEELLIALVSSLKNGSCILIDGLDEFDQSDRPHRLVSLPKRLTAFPMVRLCVSSRPLSWLEPHVTSTPSLQLHKMTARDIASLARQTLQEEFEFYASSLHSEQGKLLRIIEEKAEGVFLWVRYALYSLSQGIRGFDDAKTLMRRLEELPSGMEELFKHMWHHHEDSNERHREEAAKILYCGKFLHMRLFNLMVIFDSELSRHYLTTLRPSDDQELVSKCEMMKKRLMVRTAGLFICEPAPLPNFVLSLKGRKAAQREAEGPPSLICTVMVSYLHRTVHDFLWGTEFGRSIVALSDEQILCLHRQVLYGRLAAIIEDLECLNIDQPRDLCQYVVDHIDSEYVSMRLIDSTLQRLVKERRGNESCEICSNWYNELQEHDAFWVIYTDFVGLLVDMGACDVVKSFILEQKPTALYKGYVLAVALSRLDYPSRHLKPGMADLIKWLLDQGADAFTRQALSTGAKYTFRLSPFEIAMLLVFDQLCEHQYTAVLHSLNALATLIEWLPEGSSFLVPVKNFRSSGLEIDKSDCVWLFTNTRDILIWIRINAWSFCQALKFSLGRLYIDRANMKFKHDFDIKSQITNDNVVYITLPDLALNTPSDVFVYYNDVATRRTVVPGSRAQGMVLANLNVTKPSSKLLPEVLLEIREACRDCEEVILLDELERLGLLLREGSAYVPPRTDDAANSPFARPNERLDLVE